MAFLHVYSLFFLAMTVLVAFHSELGVAFRLDADQSGVVFEDELTTTAIPDLVMMTTQISTAEVSAENVMPISFDADITVANRTKMIVANEISNLPRFDPKNANKNKQQTNWSPSSESPIMDPVESDEVTSLRNVSNRNTNLYEDSCQFCLEARFMQHYFSKNCIAMELQEDCKPKFCPKYFDCPKEKELPKDGCMYQEKLYKFGHNVPHRDPCQHCVCINSTNGPMLSCAISECVNAWTPLEPNCYRKYTDGKCCPEIVCAPKNKTLSTCSFEGNVHNFGDYFSPEGDPCHNCLCDERWAKSKTPLESSCTRIECNFDFDRPENKGCVPVYSDKSCCPMYFHCPDDSNNINQPKCKFGGNSYEVGEKIKVKQHEVCLECSCLVPPEISCKHKSCPVTPQNCTSVFIEGECCHQFKCEEELDSLPEENSMKDVEKMTSGEDVQCPPMDACKHPCKLFFDELDDSNASGLGEQSERIKCPRCDCSSQSTVKNLKTLEVNQNLNNSSNATVNIPCGSPKLPCTPQADGTNEESDQERWEKSMKFDKVNNGLKPKLLSKRCPDIACEYPCYIYKVSAADCPRCSCPSNMDKFSSNKVQKFVATSTLAIKNGQ